MRRDPWRGAVALVLAVGLVGAVLAGIIGAIVNPAHDMLTTEEATTLATVLGGILGALAVYLGGPNGGPPPPRPGRAHDPDDPEAGSPHAPPRHGEPAGLRADHADTLTDMSRPRTALVVAFAVVLMAAGTAGGYWAGNRAGASAGAAAGRAATAAADRAERDLSASMSYDAQAQAAAAAALAGADGICWRADAGQVVAISAPVKRPGGETCPAGAPRYSPVEPQPVGQAVGAPGG